MRETLLLARSKRTLYPTLRLSSLRARATTAATGGWPRVPEELTAEPARTAALESASTGSFDLAIAPSDAELAWLLNNADVIVDAILGTGFAHDRVREPYATWIRLANEAHRKHGVRIVAADCPSGLSAQTGATASECIAADETVTMIVPKTGLLESQAYPYVGTLLLAPLISIEEYFDDLL